MWSFNGHLGLAHKDCSPLLLPHYTTSFDLRAVRWDRDIVRWSHIHLVLPALWPAAGCTWGESGPPLQSHCWLQHVSVVSICTKLATPYYSGLRLQSIRDIPGRAVSNETWIGLQAQPCSSGYVCSTLNSCKCQVPGGGQDKGRPWIVMEGN